MKNKLFRTALVLCLSLLLLGTVQAADSHEHNGITFQGTSSLPQEAGSYYLTQDVELSSTWSPKGSTVLDLNGYNITYTGETGSVILVNENVTFTLYDCNGTNSTHYGYWDESGTTYTISDTAPTSGDYVTLTGGIISGGKGSYSDALYSDVGGGITVKGTFTMYGGTIAGNTANIGGGVFAGGIGNTNNAVLNMYGGTITGNLATGAYVDGGGIYLCKASFQVRGATIIRGNYAENSDGSSLERDNISMLESEVLVVGALEDTASIGITESCTADTDFEVAKGGLDYTLQESDFKKFFSDEGDKALYFGTGTGRSDLQGTKVQYNVVKQHAFTESSGYTTCKDTTCNHTRNVEYSTSDLTTITKTFSDADKDCSYSCTLTILAPKKAVYDDGEDAAATLTTKGWLGTVPSATNITYAKVNSDETTMFLDQAPTDAGKYIASVTVGNATASITYEIEKANQTAPETGEGYSIDYEAETITIEIGYQVSSDAAHENLLTNSASITPGATYYIRKEETPNYKASPWTEFTLSVRPDAPSVTHTDETAANKNDGTITDVTSAMEYKRSTDGSWTSVPDNAVTLSDLAPGTYYVRYKATSTSFASAQASVTIKAATTASSPIVSKPIQKPDDSGSQDGDPDDNSHENIIGGAHYCPSLSYTDLDITKWYHASVDYVLNEKLMIGTGNAIFQPDGTLTRAMMVQILYNLAGAPEVTLPETAPFADVSLDTWYAKAIIWGLEQGVIEGYGNGNFGPGDYVTREQMAAMLWRNEGRETPTQTSLSFTDADTVSSWAMNAVLWANQQGILNGRGDGTLAPKDYATRAQAAQVLMNYLDK